MAGPTRKPSPGPWRRKLGVPSATQQAQATGRANATVIVRAPLAFPWVKPKFTEIPNLPNLTEEIPQPAQNLYDNAPPRKPYPQDELLPNVAANTAVVVATDPAFPRDLSAPPSRRYPLADQAWHLPDLIANLPPTIYDSLPLKKWPEVIEGQRPPDTIPILVLSVEYPSRPAPKWREVIEGQKPLDPSVITSFNYEYPAPKLRGFPSDAIVYNLALLTPTVVVPQPQPLIDYPALARRALADLTLPNIAVQPLPAPTALVRSPLVFEWRGQVRGLDFVFPNIASITFTPPPQPPSTVDAGRHHKRYKVKLGSRTVYFATKAEAVAARERHRDVLILKAVATGADPRKIKVRRARITQVTVDGRHPPDLAPAVQIAKSHDAHAETLKALKEARMREEEEIAIALLLAQ